MGVWEECEYSPIATLQVSKHVILCLHFELAGPGDVTSRPRHPHTSVERLVD